MKTITLEQHQIGEGHPCFIIAEAGVNHNGNIDLAHKLIDIAAECKVHAIKFQTFIPEKLVTKDAQMADYQERNTGKIESQESMLAKLVLPTEAYVSLQSHAKEKGLIFLSTPFDEESADFLESLHVPAFKIPSGEVVNHPLLEHIARKNKPVLMSSGMCTISEVQDAVHCIRQTGNDSLALFHCVSNYPTDPEECNLNAMLLMEELFQVPSGWSDHTEGIDISLAAVALGAKILEKHFTLDKSLPGPDHKASLEPKELKELVLSAQRVFLALGNRKKEPQESEKHIAVSIRKSIFTKKDMSAGDIIHKDDVIFLRPGTGLYPSQIHKILGRKLKKALSKYSNILDSDLE